MERKDHPSLSSFLSKNAIILSSQERRAFIDKCPSLVEKKGSTLPGTGDGLFAKVDMKGFTMIPYIGEFIDEKAVEEYRSIGSPRDSYLCYDYETSIYYDGYPFLSTPNAAHSNHASPDMADFEREDCWGRQNGSLHFYSQLCIWVILTLREIKAGEEILINYGKGYFKGRPGLKEVILGQ